MQMLITWILTMDHIIFKIFLMLILIFNNKSNYNLLRAKFYNHKTLFWVIICISKQTLNKKEVEAMKNRYEPKWKKLYFQVVKIRTIQNKLIQIIKYNKANLKNRIYKVSKYKNPKIPILRISIILIIQADWPQPKLIWKPLG